MDSEEIGRFVAIAGLIFSGHPQRHHRPDAPAPEAESGEIVPVRIDRVLRSTEVLRGTAGQEALVLSSRAARLREAGEVIMFAQCLSLGRHLLLRELSHAAADGRTRAEIADAIQREDERPLRERVQAAELIVTGEVVEAEPAPGPLPSSEHDPIWWVARLAVGTVLKGRKPSGRVTVFFASSRDRDWAPRPKLYAGVTGIFLLHRPEEKERRDGLPEEGARGAYVAIDPLDHLPAERLEHVERLIGAERGER